MLKELKQVAIWIAIVFALLVAWKAFDDYRFVKAHQRAMQYQQEYLNGRR